MRRLDGRIHSLQTNLSRQRNKRNHDHNNPSISTSNLPYRLILLMFFHHIFIRIPHSISTLSLSHNPPRSLLMSFILLLLPCPAPCLPFTLRLCHLHRPAPHQFRSIRRLARINFRLISDHFSSPIHLLELVLLILLFHILTTLALRKWTRPPGWRY